MKNIHLLATPNPSRLFYSGNSSVLTLNKYSTLFRAFERSPQYVYITSHSEDINENEYIITKDGRLVQVSYLLSSDLEGASKVILTTDPELIKDGVQAIDDEFLEWFVKNPSCEEVEVKCYSKFNDGDFSDYKIFEDKLRHSNKIIIPKEEQKQHLIEMMESDEELGLYDSQVYNAEEVRQIAEWSFHFYKRNDLSDSELEAEWESLLNERLNKK